MAYVRRRTIGISVKEFNAILKDLKHIGLNVIFADPSDKEQLKKYGGFIGEKVFLADKMSRIYLTFRSFETDKVVTYWTEKNDNVVKHLKTGMDSYRIAQRYYKSPVMHETKEDAPLCSQAIHYHNKKFEGKWTKAIDYDINSSYSWALLKPIPDTTKPLGPGILQKGQIGFIYPQMMTETPGMECDERFPAMESPYKKFVAKYYKGKKNAKTKQERQNYKDILNFLVGYWQRKNCFLRSTIVERQNRRISYFIHKYKDHVIYSNTDSIVSDIHIPEIEQDIGDEVGQWKVEDRGEVALMNNGYQWKGEKPKISGMAKGWLSEAMDITRDIIDRRCVQNKYYYDKVKMQLKLNPNYKKYLKEQVNQWKRK